MTEDPGYAAEGASMNERDFKRGLRFGQLIGVLSVARQAVRELELCRDLLSIEDSQLILTISDQLIGVDQRAWGAASKEAEVAGKGK